MYLNVILFLGIIPNNLRHEETIVQITEALDNLDAAVLYIFNCIDKRLTENSQRYFTFFLLSPNSSKILFTLFHNIYFLLDFQI